MEKKILIIILFIFLFINIAGFLAIENDSETFAGEKQVVNIINSESASKGEGPILVNEIDRNKDGLNISYSFDNSKYVGDAITIDLWIMSVNGSEIKRASDNFPINKAGSIKRDFFIEFSKDLTGVYSVYIQVNSEPASLVKEVVELEKFVESKNKKSVTGKAILDQNPGRMIGYGIFVLIIVVVIFFIIKNHDKDIDKTSGDFTSKEKSLEAKKQIEVKK
jgi:hypothetical protein